MAKLINCLKCQDRITENECVIDERCNGCENLKAARKSEFCPELLVQTERDYMMTDYNFSDTIISDYPARSSIRGRSDS
jgi:hypothetical protein